MVEKPRLVGIGHRWGSAPRNGAGSPGALAHTSDPTRQVFPDVPEFSESSKIGRELAESKCVEKSGAEART